RGRVAEPGIPIPAARGAVRDARGDAPDRPRDVAGRTWQPGPVRRPSVPRDAPDELAAIDLAAAGPDHDRRRRRAEDAPAGRPVRGRDERLRRAGADPPQVRGAPGALRGNRARPERDRALDAPVDPPPASPTERVHRLVRRAG